MTDFLLELRSEEIPARMQAKAREDLAKLFAGELAKAGLSAGETVTYATPRRLALIVRGLPDATEAVSEEVKGPRANAPEQALDGFLRKTGLTRADLTERDGVLYAITEKPGQATAEVLAEAIPAIIRAFPWPKSMRWGEASASTESLRWVRPLQGIVAIFGTELVPCEVAGIASGFATVGHRFHHPGIITIGGADDYVEKLRVCHVIVDQDERAAIIRERAAMLAGEAGLTLVADDGLVAENAGLTEWPVPLLGRFDEAFLDVPPEVIQLTARVNQKYFVCNDAGGRLANAFVCTANIDAADGGAKIVEGNRKVLAARLSDARFFWNNDLQVDSDALSKRLDAVVYFDGLGTYAEKQLRVSRLAEEISQFTTSVSGYEAETLGNLSKIDLASSTVGEFPELQGVIGAYLVNRKENYQSMAPQLRHLYASAKQINEDSNIQPLANVLQLADRLDAVIGFAVKKVWFTGSKDPFAIRQSAQICVAALLRAPVRCSLKSLIQKSYVSLVESFGYNRNVYAVEQFVSREKELREVETPLFGAGMADTMYRKVEEWPSSSFRARPASVEMLEARGWTEAAVKRINRYYGRSQVEVEPFDRIADRVLELLIDRLKVQQREAGVRHDLIDAVFALGGEDDLVRLLARVRALQGFVTTADGANLLAGYKRAANILKKEAFEGGADGAPNAAPESDEAALIAALDAAEPRARAAVEAEDFEGAMGALATLRAPIDAFFTNVTVNDPEPAKRAARLALLARVRDAVHAVADFSRIEG